MTGTEGPQAGTGGPGRSPSGTGGPIPVSERDRGTDSGDRKARERTANGTGGPQTDRQWDLFAEGIWEKDFHSDSNLAV